MAFQIPIRLSLCTLPMRCWRRSRLRSLHRRARRCWWRARRTTPNFQAPLLLHSAMVSSSHRPLLATIAWTRALTILGILCCNCWCCCCRFVRLVVASLHAELAVVAVAVRRRHHASTAGRTGATTAIARSALRCNHGHHRHTHQHFPACFQRFGESTRTLKDGRQTASAL